MLFLTGLALIVEFSLIMYMYNHYMYNEFIKESAEEDLKWYCYFNR